MKQLTVQEALQNIDIVVSNAHMDRKEHQALQQSVMLVAQRCELADRLEKAIVKAEETINPGEDEVLEDGPTDKQLDVPGIDQEDSE